MNWEQLCVCVYMYTSMRTCGAFLDRCVCIAKCWINVTEVGREEPKFLWIFWQCEWFIMKLEVECFISQREEFTLSESTYLLSVWSIFSVASMYIFIDAIWKLIAIKLNFFPSFYRTAYPFFTCKIFSCLNNELGKKSREWKCYLGFNFASWTAEEWCWSL